MPRLPLLPLLAIVALLALAGSGIVLVAGWGSPQLAAHLAFAVGVMPLILAAMAYFVPVLTRGSPPVSANWISPVLALTAGVLAATAFARDLSPTVLGAAALCGLLAALTLGGWTLLRAGRMFGPRHRGLDWYLAALGFLVLALLAVLLMPAFPAQRGSLRLFHLHANLLGFVGLTALGTLQVLLPTCLGQADPGAIQRLRRDVPWAIAGAMLIASGASLRATGAASTAALALAVPGALLYSAVVLRMLRAWLRRYGGQLLQGHGAAPSLVAASAGLLCLLGLGAAHGAGWMSARPSISGFVIAFLLPLVSGAAGHLLPVWLRPGTQTDWHRHLRARLTRWGGMRAFVLLGLGLALSLS